MRLSLWYPTAVILLMTVQLSAEQTLNQEGFSLRYDDRGITSLKRTNDIHDTEYLMQGGVLGNVAIQYKSYSNPHWSVAQQIALEDDTESTSKAIRFRIGSPGKTLAEICKVSAPPNALNLSSLHDMRWPLATNRGRTKRNDGNSSALANIDAFAWKSEREETQWVEYTFPESKEVSTAEVFWQEQHDAGIKLPRSWRLLYLIDGQWNEVQTIMDGAALSSHYGVLPGVFNRIDFVPVETTSLRLEVTLASDAGAGIYEWRIGPRSTLESPKDLSATGSFELCNESLLWTISLVNLSDQPLLIGDLALPLNMAENTPDGRGQIYTQKLIRHSFIEGHGSWIFWQRSNAVGPFLLMVPEGPTKFEYNGPFIPSTESASTPDRIALERNRRCFTPFIHASVSSKPPMAQGKAAGRDQPWRLPISSRTLAPRGTSGDSVTYRFRFIWTSDLEDVRQKLYEQGSIDVNIVPGMSLPCNLSALIALRSQKEIKAMAPEFPDKTKVEFVADRGNGVKLYRVTFEKLGENLLTVQYGDDQWTTLEFFVTEPLETLIKKRAAFLVNSHQHKDPRQWWYGVYSDWDQVKHALRGPGNRDGLAPWLVEASDDAGNARPAYIASKNVFMPVQAEIDSVELYIKHYLFAGNNWKDGIGGMQMTEAEQYPYGIYGTFDNWHQHRTIDPQPPENFIPQDQTLPKDVGWTRLHREHLWRIYDYPHIMLLYYRMYQIAKAFPGMTNFANANEYLMLAYHTSVAYWTVPMQTDKPYGWSANSVPTMNEAFVPELIMALEREGKQTEAAKLHELWNSKVIEFVQQETRPNLFGSEFAFDSTGFESTAAMAKYALRRATQPTMANGVLPGYTAEQAKEFMEFQLRLNIGDRGWLENTYYQLGSDYRGNLTYLLSYMSQMGGWGILDYGLRYAEDPAPFLRLGYASTLSSWALINSGTEESNYGFWWPGKENDGAAGGGFMPEPFGPAWIRKSFPRGAWSYSAEQDVGFCGAMRAHATIVTKDPIFGEFAYGGDLFRSGDTIQVIPKDGLRARIHVIRDKQRFHMELLGANLASEQPIVINDTLTHMDFLLESSPGTGYCHIELAGLSTGTYTLSIDGSTSEFEIRDLETPTIHVLALGDQPTTHAVLLKLP